MQGPVVLTRLLGLIGVVLILTGVVFGFRSVSVAGTDCGSAFQPAGGITPMDCDSRLNSAGADVALLTGSGVIIGAAALTLRMVSDRRAHSRV